MDSLGWCVWMAVAVYWVRFTWKALKNTSLKKVSDIQMEVAEKSEESVEHRQFGAFLTPLMPWMKMGRLLGIVSSVGIFALLFLSAITGVSKFHLLWLVPSIHIFVLIMCLCLFHNVFSRGLIRGACGSALKEESSLTTEMRRGNGTGQ